jgi:hypothetical protein
LPSACWRPPSVKLSAAKKALTHALPGASIQVAMGPRKWDGCTCQSRIAVPWRSTSIAVATPLLVFSQQRRSVRQVTQRHEIAYFI